MSAQNFNETFSSLIESISIFVDTIRNQECLFLTKGNEHDAEDRINEESNNFKNSFLEVSMIIKDLFFLLGKKKKDI